MTPSALKLAQVEMWSGTNDVVRAEPGEREATMSKHRETQQEIRHSKPPQSRASRNMGCTHTLAPMSACTYAYMCARLTHAHALARSHAHVRARHGAAWQRMLERCVRQLDQGDLC